MLFLSLIRGETLISNLSVSIPSAGEYVYRFPGVLGAGNIDRKNASWEAMRLLGIAFPAKAVRVNCPAVALGAVVSGSKIGRPPLKSPFRFAVLGTWELMVVPCRVRPPS